MSFKEQITEDLDIIAENHAQYNPQLQNYEYAINHWMLDKIFNVDDELIASQITDNKDDHGIDCFVYYEDSKELYLIQNKWYDTTQIKTKYVQNVFPVAALQILQNNDYQRSKELQCIFNKLKDDPDASIHLHLYVFNDKINQKAKDAINKFSAKVKENYPTIQARMQARLFFIDDIERVYTNDRHFNTKVFEYLAKTVNSGTVLNIDPQSYGLPNSTDAKYVMIPVSEIHNMITQANDQQYSLFSENIREYLGLKGVNKRMSETLECSTDRFNFFYYNNGITIVCNNVTKKQINDGNHQLGYVLHNPQVINGCQTSHTIHDVLKHCPDPDVNQSYEGVYVMAKILVLDASNPNRDTLLEQIVRFNNSQNRVDEKAFEMVKALYLNLQRDLKDRGFLLLVKQSDRTTFRKEYKITKDKNELLALGNEMRGRFGLEASTIPQTYIDLAKLLQVMLAFAKGGYEAYSQKSHLFKPGKEAYQIATEQLKCLTHNQVLWLYLLYLRAETDKKASDDKRTPVPYYVLGFLGQILRDNNIETKDFIERIDTLEKFNALYKVITWVTRKYTRLVLKNKNIDYQRMIKTPIEQDKFYAIFNDRSDLKELIPEEYGIFESLLPELI